LLLCNLHSSSAGYYLYKEVCILTLLLCNCRLCNSLHRFDGLLEEATPYQRIIESPDISEEVKDRLRKTYESLNPAFLKRNIDRHKREIERAYEMKMEKRKREMQKRAR